MNSGVIYGLERGEEKGRLCNGLERRGQEENYSYLFKIPLSYGWSKNERIKIIDV